MLGKRILSYMLTAALLASASHAQQQPQAPTTTTTATRGGGGSGGGGAPSHVGRGAPSDVLVTLPVQVDGSLRNLELLKGESIEDAAMAFVRNNGLLQMGDDTRVREVLDQLSGLLQERVKEINREAEPVTATPSGSRSTTPAPTVELVVPLTINGMTSELTKYVGEDVEAAVERYLLASGYTLEVMRELYPKIVELVQQKLVELQPPRKELFAFELTIDGQAAVARHFEEGDPMEEAEATLRSIGIDDEGFIRRTAPQIANAIYQRMAQVPAAASPTTAVAPPQAPSVPAARELFSIPLTVGDRNVVLVHREGQTSRESAIRFLQDNAITDSAIANELLPQLVRIVDTRLAEHIKAQAEATATTATPATPTTTTMAAAALREPLVRLPINLDTGVAHLEYFAGDSVERTVERFLSELGLQSGPAFNENAQRLSARLQQEIAAKTTTPSTTTRSESVPRAPLVTLPVTLQGKIFDLEFFEGQNPATVANTFCVEKYEVIRAELGVQFDGDQLLACKNVLETKILELAAVSTRPQEPPQQPASASPSRPATAQPPANPRGRILFTLDIDIDQETHPLTVYENDDMEALARAFCERHNVDLANLPALLDAMHNQKNEQT